MLTGDIGRIIEEYAPPSEGAPGDELGLIIGSAEAEVTGVGTCWSPTLAVLKRAAELGLNLVIAHEPLIWWAAAGRDREQSVAWFEEDKLTAKVPNQKRWAAVYRHGLTVYRYHSNWDVAPKYGMQDTIARLLGLGEKQGGHKWGPIHVIEPTTVGELAERGCRALGVGPVRVVGDPERLVTRVAITHGGFGQMFTFAEVAMRGGAEVAIFGEMLDYTIRYCVEVDLSAIEFGHYATEHPAMAAMAEFLREQLPADIPVHALESGEPWTWRSV